MKINKYINYLEYRISEAFRMKSNGLSFSFCLDCCNDINAMINFAYDTDLIDSDTMRLLTKKIYRLLDFSDD